MKRQITTENFILLQCVLFFIPLLLFFSVATQKQASAAANMTAVQPEESEQVEVASILGYVEVRKQGQNYWEAAKRGMKLSAEDLVRIPPKAIFRVRFASGEAVYFVPGQERLFKDLAPSEKRRIVDGRTRSSKAADMSRQRLSQLRQSALKRKNSPMTTQYAEFLSSVLSEDADSGTVRDFVQRSLKDISITTNAGYPSRNIAIAQRLLDALRKSGIKFSNREQSEAPIQPPSTTLEIRQGDDLDVARLYLALLNAAGVEAKAWGDNNTPLFIVFNSGIAADAARSVTVNKRLYLVENDLVWFPVQITPSTDNFIKAWYKGSDVNRITNYELRTTN